MVVNCRDCSHRHYDIACSKAGVDRITSCHWYKEKEMKSLKHEDWYCCWTNELERDAMIKALIDKGFVGVCDEWCYHGCDYVFWDGHLAGDSAERFKKDRNKITVSEFWQRLAINDDYPDELPPIKTEDALRAMNACDDVKRTFKTLWPEIF